MVFYTTTVSDSFSHRSTSAKVYHLHRTAHTGCEQVACAKANLSALLRPSKWRRCLRATVMSRSLKRSRNLYSTLLNTKRCRLMRRSIWWSARQIYYSKVALSVLLVLIPRQFTLFFFPSIFVYHYITFCSFKYVTLYKVLYSEYDASWRVFYSSTSSSCLHLQDHFTAASPSILLNCHAIQTLGFSYRYYQFFPWNYNFALSLVLVHGISML